MKFRFLGDGDCPDWLLAEINTMSRMTSIKIKMLGEVISKYLIEAEFDEEKTKKITQDAKLELSDAKAVVTALELILTSSARYGVSTGDLNNELQQLGLPREHSAAIARLHTNYYLQIMSVLSSQSLRVNRLTKFEVSTCDRPSPFHMVSLKLKKWNENDYTTTINISRDDIRILLSELKTAMLLMEDL